MVLSKGLIIAGLALGTSAQNLTAALGSIPQASALLKYLSAFPSLGTSLQGLKNVTLLAPSNKAIAELTQAGILTASTPLSEVENILMYHVLTEEFSSKNFSTTPVFPHTELNSTLYTNVTGGQVVEAALVDSKPVFTSGLKEPAMVVKADVMYNNGIIHVIDTLLTIPLNVSSTAVAADLTAFTGALAATNLLNTLDAASDITIFAPSNSAFEAIGSAAGNLTMKQLAGILEYHVINGTIAYSSSLGNGSVKTLAGTNLNITVVDGAVFVNAARVITSDILISGGVMHIIDSVLNPMGSAKPKPGSTTPVVQFSGVSSASLGPLTSAIPPPSMTISALVTTDTAVAKGYKTVKGGPIGTNAGGHPMTTSKGKSKGSSSSSSGIAALPTGMVGAAALFGGAAVVANFW